MITLIPYSSACQPAKKSGLDLHEFWNAIRAGCGNSFTWETSGPSLLRGDYDPTFTIDLHCKDLDLGYQIAKDHKVAGRLGKSSWVGRSIYKEANLCLFLNHFPVAVRWDLSSIYLDIFPIQFSPCFIKHF